ncbi:YIP1 family protein [Pseudodonghicola flavimaris]|uniref:YIP1 family protein n=1 Tax=Pseudodonghicola flavimaris TaxID=3050036 RepID=A0ABT7F193_9RHOB|nr:YIP1 family protein [Pseudodonghicola flavimaris]MDK3018345.1 YIP1 family protein [Pseudodonghicola flavimaris]
MSVTGHIVATYRGPGRVMRELLASGQREDRALAILMAGCVIVFVAQLPRLSREAYLSGQELNMILGASLLAWVIIAPLLFYLLAAASHVLARAVGGRGGWYGARLALFWALLASTPALLLHGLVSGFIGPGPARDAVGLIWLGLFLWFWLSGLRQAERQPV